MVKGKSFVKKIVVFGGFAADNAGDEAQINQTYKELKENFPGYEIKILSHVQQHTYAHHGCPAVAANSRMAIWHSDRGGLYGKISGKWPKKIFLAKGLWSYFNAFLMSRNLPPFMLSDETVSFLYELKTADLVYISGGVFLTGDTLSRLYDHLFVIEMADLFGVPCVLSGHNIGIWDSEFTRKFAAHGFSKAKCITTRDATSSIQDLADIGVTGEHIFVTHDDALFCEKSKDTEKLRNLCRLKDGEKYITFSPCLHDPVKSSGSDRYNVPERLAEIMEWLLENTDYVIEILPMSPSDRVISKRLLFHFQNERVRMVRLSDYDFKIVRGIIAGSEFAITMRHHPIIFAVGECVPAIALNKVRYYAKKNIGALSLVGMEKYSLDLSAENYMEQFVDAIEHMDIAEDRKIIGDHLAELRKRKHRLYEYVRKVILR